MAATAACPATGRAAAPSLPAGCNHKFTWQKRVARCAWVTSKLAPYLQQGPKSRATWRVESRLDVQLGRPESRPLLLHQVWLSMHVLSTCAGQLTRDFKHTRLDFAIIEEDGVKKLKVDCHLGKRKSLAVMRTVTSHIQNLFTGVSKVRLR